MLFLIHSSNNFKTHKTPDLEEYSVLYFVVLYVVYHIKSNIHCENVKHIMKTRSESMPTANLRKVIPVYKVFHYVLEDDLVLCRNAYARVRGKISLLSFVWKIYDFFHFIWSMRYYSFHSRRLSCRKFYLLCFLGVWK